ncbi:hypothetical protein BX600DRAFT_9398 [Xylariales sp. PMI_506]|nr:hypothetical protein BX600DRAFT_9398 [Xylariales sp. PMI_506]
MSGHRLSVLALGASLVFSVNGQESGWATGQVNATMCLWQNPRAAVVRDTVYIDGGYLWWVPGLEDGSFGGPTQDGNPLGLIYLLNFSQPFDSTTNYSSILGVLPKVSSGTAANNLAPNYFDGGMLANDDEFFTYGGLLTDIATYAPPADNSVLVYFVDSYGTDKPDFLPGFQHDILTGNITRYVAYGGAASAPSENKGWYFSGLRSPSWGEIYYPMGNDSLSAVNASDTLITVDMTTQYHETWTNSTLPGTIKGRAGPELVWVPVGSQGILVALGGVTYPDFDNSNYSSENEAQSKIDSPAFMSTIDIYDIAGDTWYQQPTANPPDQTTLGCAVVAAAQDGSSYNIYYYGGYDGLHITQAFSDDVWVLSLPSFQWVKVTAGSADHARAGHQCVKPYPDQMITIGGFTPLTGGEFSCLEDDGILQVYNLSTGTWLDSYDPSVWSEYVVPDKVLSVIGGDATGGATLTTPSPSGWVTTGLSNVFSVSYTSTISTWYPYASVTTNNTRPDLPTSSPSSSGGTPKWVAPVLGVVLSLVFITAVVVAILLYRRRKLLRKNGGTTEGGTDENGHRILSWIRGQDGSHKAPTVTTEDPVMPTDDLDSRVASLSHTTGGDIAYVGHHEMADTPLIELMDTSRPAPRAELGDTGLTPVEIINRHSHFAPNRTTGGSSLMNPSSFGSSFSVSHDQGSISSGSQAIPSRGFGTPVPPGGTAVDAASYHTHHRQASAELDGEDGSGGGRRIVSDLSEISPRDQAHLRHISDVSAGSVAGTEPPTPLAPHHGSGPVTPPGPVSPPSAEEREGSDYITAGASIAGKVLGGGGNGPTGSLRRSVFRESEGDMEDPAKHQ